MFWYLLIAHITLFFISANFIILYGVRPTRSFSWLLLVLVLPFFGAILYLLFGINRRKFKFYELKENQKRKLYNKDNFSSEEAFKLFNFKSINKQRLATLIQKTTHFNVRQNNQVKLLNKAEEAYELMFERLKSATKFIHIQCYIFEKGEVLDQLCEILNQQLEKGVEVRLLFDAFGSYDANKTYFKKLKKNGAKVYPVMPIKYGSFLYTMNYRNHRKAVIIDGNIGFAGGMNFSDKYLKAEGELGIWEDLHLELGGTIVNDLHRVFIKDYYFASGEQLLDLDTCLSSEETSGDILVQLVASGPDSEYLSVMQQYLMLINVAQKKIKITNPYFIPNQALLEATKMAALSGVEVEILVPFKTDSSIATHSMYSYFEELLGAGVTIYLKDNFTHSKAIIVDQEVASVGSGNFDHRSFEHNFETNMLLYDVELAKALSKIFDKNCAASTKLELDKFKKRPLRNKLKEGTARFFSPLL